MRRTSWNATIQRGSDMARRTRTLLIPFVILAVVLPWAAPTRAAEKTAAQMLPETTVFYAELPRADRLIQTLLDHPLAKRVYASDPYQQGLRSPQFEELMAVVGALEDKLGKQWRPTLESLTRHGVFFGADIASKGGVLLAKSDDPELTQKFAAALADIAREIAIVKGEADPVEQREYKGFNAYRIDKGYHAAIGPWLLISNQADLARSVADAFLGGDAPTLDGDAEFRAARSAKPNGVSGWAYLKTRTLRDLGIGREAFVNRSDNPGAELLVGGILSIVRRADFATMEVRAEQDGLKFAIVVPRSEGDVPRSRSFFFAPSGEGSAPKPLKPEGTILSVASYRDIAGMWLAAPDLFDEKTAAAMAKADGDLSNFFGGRAFGADVLARLSPRSQLVVVRQEFDPKGAVPQIKLPGFALITQVKDPKVIVPNIKVGFQTLVAFANIDGASKGRPTLMLTNEKRDDGELLSAEYLVMADQNMAEMTGIHFNFSPAMAISGDTVILASTKPLAEKLLALAKQRGDATISQNTLVEVDGAGAIEALRDNREQLIAQNMIEQGNSRGEAEMAIDTLMQIVELIRGANLSLTRTDETLSLEIGVTLNPLD